jgi:uncharacterized membrane protein (UPF0127 family)
MSLTDALKQLPKTGTVRLCHADGRCLPLRVRRCETFTCRLRGLMFRGSLAEDEALLFVQGTEDRLGAAIHMLFVFFPIGVVWLDATGTVVDTVLAKPFRPFYAPRGPARFFVEGPPSLLSRVSIGETLRVESYQASAA